VRRPSSNQSSRLAPPPGTGRRSRFGRWGLLLAGLAVAGAVVLAWRLSAGGRDRDQGLEAARAGDFATAEPLLRRAREARPDDLEVIRALAAGYDRANRADEAAAEYAHWSDLRPDEPEPVVATFRLWERLRFFDKAADAGARLLRFPALDRELYPHIVAVFMLVGRVREAAEAARAGLAVVPENPRLRHQLAEALHAQGQSGEARDVLEKLTRDAPDFTDGWSLRGTVAADTGDPAGAIPSLERALALDPANLGARYALGLALRRCGREDDARRELARFEKVRLAHDLADASVGNPERFDLALRAAVALFDAGLDRDGHAFVRRVLDRDPTSAEALRLREAHRATQPR
jgi:Flp pilus assembly protein TadD